MMRNLLLLLCSLLAAISLYSQSKIRPTAREAKVIVLLRDFGDRPVPKARVALQATDNETRFAEKTNKEGWCEFLVPIGKTYYIHVEDSLEYELLHVKDQSFMTVRRKVFYQGSVRGKPLPVPDRPLFSMKPPPEGLAMIKLQFEGLDRKPLKGERVRLSGRKSEEEWSGETNAKGEVIFQVPVGDNYIVALKHRKRLDEFEIPKRGGSYRIHSRYVYAGALAIDQARRERRELDSLSNPWKYTPEYLAWKAYNDSLIEAQAPESAFESADSMRRVALQSRAGEGRDAAFHQLKFREIPVRKMDPDYTVVDRPYGFDLQMKHQSRMNSPFYMDGKLFMGGGFNNSSFHCVDPYSGRSEWSLSLGERGPAMATGGEGKVAVCTESCTIYVVDAGTGDLVWSKWLTSSLRSSPCIADGRLYMAYEDEDGGFLFSERQRAKVSLACFDANTGEILWQQWLDEEVISAPVASEGALWCSTYGGRVYKLDPKSGEVLANASLMATSAPIVEGGEVILSQRGPDVGVVQERIAVLDGKNLELKRSSYFQQADYLTRELQLTAALQQRAWAGDIGNGLGDETGYRRTQGYTSASLVGLSGASALLHYQGSRPLAWKGMLICSMGSEVVAFDGQSLQERWRYRLTGAPADAGGHALSPPLQAGGYILVGSVTGKILMLDPKTGRVAQVWDTGLSHRTQAVVIEGRVFAAAEEGRLAVIRTGLPHLTGWAAFGGNMRRDNHNLQD